MVDLEGLQLLFFQETIAVVVVLEYEVVVVHEYYSGPRKHPRQAFDERYQRDSTLQRNHKILADISFTRLPPCMSVIIPLREVPKRSTPCSTNWKMHNTNHLINGVPQFMNEIRLDGVAIEITRCTPSSEICSWVRFYGRKNPSVYEKLRINRYFCV